MQSEQDWMSSQDADESTAKERYNYFTRPEPFRDADVEGYKVRYVDDPYLGPNTPVRDLLIGMVRNAKEENRKEVTAYLKPYPHMRIDAAKPLQGWYQSKVNESKQSRPRPCLVEGSLVGTPFGLRRIEALRVGDMVLGFDFNTGRTAAVAVQGTLVQTKEEYVEVELEDGRTLRLTTEHPVYTRNRGWVKADDLTTSDDLLETTDGRQADLRRLRPEEPAGREALRGLGAEPPGQDGQTPALVE
jgi:hypothetical protein